MHHKECEWNCTLDCVYVICLPFQKDEDHSVVPDMDTLNLKGHFVDFEPNSNQVVFFSHSVDFAYIQLQNRYIQIQNTMRFHFVFRCHGTSPNYVVNSTSESTNINI